MMIFDVLVAHQEEITTAFARAHDAAESGDLDDAREQFAALSTRLLGVMRAEHAVVYPMFVYSAGLGDEVAEALRDHREIERMVNHIRLAPLGAEPWLDAVSRLRKQVTLHLDLEELTLFPLARLRLTNEEMESLARDFLAMEPLALAVAGASITYDFAA